MRGVLVDTHVLLWLLEDNPRLGATARDRIAQSPAVFVSAASTWELSIKAAIGKEFRNLLIVLFLITPF